jgi:D-glycero-D-manno-heptose 1,7-bisphosphate phosphatase
MVPVLWIDIVGTVIKGPNDGHRWVNEASDVEVFPEVPRLLQRYQNRGWRVVGVTNQGGIAMGHTTLPKILGAMNAVNQMCGKVFDLVMICRHHPEATELEMRVCWCRKPRIGLLIEAGLALARRHGEIYPPHLGLFVGDMDEDRLCAENAALAFMWAKDWRAGAHDLRAVAAINATRRVE